MGVAIAGVVILVAIFLLVTSLPLIPLVLLVGAGGYLIHRSHQKSVSYKRRKYLS